MSSLCEKILIYLGF